METLTQMDRKRKEQEKPLHELEEFDVDLALSLSPPPLRLRQPPPPPPSIPQPAAPPQNTNAAPREIRTRRNSTQTPRAGKEERVTPPYPWATDRRASVHNLKNLLEVGIQKISGEVVCKRCDKRDVAELDLRARFGDVWLFISTNKCLMHDRAPKEWMVPKLMDCKFCRSPECVRPVIAEKKRKINWLFLLLSQTLGCCTLDQLKYFCKHTRNHRTGAKDRVLYLTYLGLCKQLDHTGPFDR